MNIWTDGGKLETNILLNIKIANCRIEKEKQIVIIVSGVFQLYVWNICFRICNKTERGIPFFFKFFLFFF